MQQQTDGLGGRKDQIAVRGGVSVVVNVFTDGERYEYLTNALYLSALV